MDSNSNEAQVISFLDTLFKSGFKYVSGEIIDDADDKLKQIIIQSGGFIDNEHVFVDEVKYHFLIIIMKNDSLEITFKYLIDDGGAGAVKILNYIKEQKTLRKANA